MASKYAGSSGYNWRIESLELGRWRKHGYEVEADNAGTRVQTGQVIAPLTASNTGSVATAYNTPFTVQGGVPPVVVATSENPDYYAVVQSGTDTGFTLRQVRRRWDGV